MEGMGKRSPMTNWWRELDRKWVVLVAMTTASIVCYGPAVYAFTLFLGPLEEEFGWGRAAIGGSVSIFWLGAPLTILIGQWVDRYGAKRMLLAGAVLESAGFIMLGAVDTIWELYALRAFMGIGKIFVVTCIAITIPQWFDRQMGLALGICMAGLHVGGFIVTPITESLLSGYGWRTTSMVLGAVIAIVAIPPVVLGVRDKKSERAVADGPTPQPTGISFKEALGGRLYRSLLLLTVVYFSAYGAVLAHIVPYFSDLGFSSELTSGLMATVALTAAIAVVAWGAAADRASHKGLLFGVFALMSFALATTMGLTRFPSAFLASGVVVAFGFAVGCDSLWYAMLRNSFGEKEYGSIYGFWYFLTVLPLLLAPIVVGYIHDMTHSYLLAFGGLLGLLGSCLLIVSMPGFKPLRRHYVWGDQEIPSDAT